MQGYPLRSLRPIVRILERFLNFLFPQLCLGCQTPLKFNESLYCTNCIPKLPLLRCYCQRCGTPLSDNLLEYVAPSMLKYCHNCHEGDYPLARVFVAFKYEEPIKSLIHRAKFAEDFVLAYQLGRLLKQVIDIPLRSYDLILPVPLSKERLRERGYNQSLLLLWGYGGLRRVPSILERIKHTLPQSKLSAKEREKNIKGAFAVKDLVRDKRILLVDDVMTSGATLREAAKVLKKASAIEVHALVLARA